MKTKLKKIRSTYAPGDPVTFRRDTTPKYVLEMLEKNPKWVLQIKAKSYNGYSINAIDPTQHGRVMHVFDLPTKHLSKGTVKAALLKAIESKQTLMRKTVEEMQAEIAEMSAQLTLMDELGVEKVEDIDLEYAMRLSKSMNIPLAEAYKALTIND
jgi:hypothetical protein